MSNFENTPLLKSFLPSQELRKSEIEEVLPRKGCSKILCAMLHTTYCVTAEWKHSECEAHFSESLELGGVQSKSKHFTQFINLENQHSISTQSALHMAAILTPVY